MKSEKDRSGKNDEGVSPVVGVILMVAITVVMAAIISSWSTSVKNPTAPTTVGLNIQRSSSNNNNITIIVSSIDPVSAAPIPYINATYTNSSNGNIVASLANANVGDLSTVPANEAGPNKLVVTAKYKDGSSRVLYNQII
ncbi:MAG: type IV pilin N-terminal domain-containing protein [Candidatus Methanoperedens sp.]|nr:type IV pilin N-terminal domain-containing protein [Candidatus Methanoperedens sp.]MCZ7371446.1 type IV pilin N-terminal domain-containing protein [Candidatus Methanoperedens sp.]